MNPRLAALVLVTLVLSTVSGCSRIYRFTGTVVDGDGNPISGARIVLYPHDWEQPSSDHSDGTSNGDGGFEATWGSAVGVEYFRMVVSKEGYKDHLRLVEADAKDLRIVLERANNVDLSDNARMAPNPVCAVWFTFALLAEPIEEARLKRTVEASQAIEVGMTPQDVRDVLGEPKGQYGERGFLAWLLMGYRPKQWMYGTFFNLDYLVLPDLPFPNPFPINIRIAEYADKDLVIDWSRDDLVTAVRRPEFEVPPFADDMLDTVNDVKELFRLLSAHPN